MATTRTTARSTSSSQRTRPPVWLGRVSYSVYILHFTAIGFINPAMAGFSPFIVFPITVVASTAAASLTISPSNGPSWRWRTAWEKTLARADARSSLLEQLRQPVRDEV
jgi:peptidoglycan/LPS O-acetylase OafA/YrhL